MLKGGQESRRYSCANVFQCDRSFRGEAVLGDVRVKGVAQVGAIDEEVKRNRFFGAKEMVDNLRETESF